jgi:hypothetical protein
MIAFFTAYTQEASDSPKAVREIHERLNIKENQLAHSAALIFCHIEFIESGVAEAVCKSLPFEVLGCSSKFLAVREVADEIMLTVAVLTSDDTEFATGVSEPLTESNAEGCIRSLYQKTAASLGAEPALIFAFPPTMLSLTGDVMLAALDRACGGIPVFGGVALDVNKQIRRPKTIYQGAAYSDRITLLLFKGPVKPRFYSVLFPKSVFFVQDAVITSAKGNQLISINNEPAVSFIEKLGLLQSDGQGFVMVIPLVVGDDNPQVVIMHGIGPEGELICGSSVETGGILNIGAITAKNVLESTNKLIQEIKKNGTGQGLFVFSCFLRNIVLGRNSTAEVELIRRELDGYPNPYLFLYSAGEICPRENVNQFYSYALIACQF